MGKKGRDDEGRGRMSRSEEMNRGGNKREKL